MMKQLFLPALLLLAVSAPAQTDEQAAIISVIEKLFDGMRTGDSTAVRSVFVPDAILQTVATKQNTAPRLLAEDFGKFIEAVGSPRTEVWDERIWSYDVRIDGPLATAWTEYTFFLGEKMSHCGVNAFMLFKGESGWKITLIADTRRLVDCRTETGSRKNDESTPKGRNK